MYHDSKPKAVYFENNASMPYASSDGYVEIILIYMENYLIRQIVNFLLSLLVLELNETIPSAVEIWLVNLTSTTFSDSLFIPVDELVVLIGIKVDCCWMECWLNVCRGK